VTNAPQHKGDTACLAREAELPATILHVRPARPWMTSDPGWRRNVSLHGLCMSARRASSIIVHRLSADAQPSGQRTATVLQCAERAKYEALQRIECRR